jgi:hypothetical protein
MSKGISHFPVHPAGDQLPIDPDVSPAPATLDTWAGPVRVEGAPTAPLTPYGQLPFFIEYLKAANLFDALVADWPHAAIFTRFLTAIYTRCGARNMSPRMPDGFL